MLIYNPIIQYLQNQKDYITKKESKMANKVEVSNQTTIGSLFWVAGWFFSIGYIYAVDTSLSALSGFQTFVMFIILIPTWPIFLGIAVGRF